MMGLGEYLILGAIAVVAAIFNLAIPVALLVVVVKIHRRVRRIEELLGGRGSSGAAAISSEAPKP